MVRDRGTLPDDGKMLKLITLATFAFTFLPPAATQCTLTQVPCDGKCAEACDSYIECSNGADETTELCSNKQCRNDGELTLEGLGDISGIFDGAGNPNTAKFKCDYGGCISMNFLCNGHEDCWDKSDETAEKCSPKKCSRREFRCEYGACIRRLYSCNGLKNCADGSDETAAACRTKRCPSSKFKCDYGGCIDLKKKCNKIVDCNDGSDESKENCGADHTFETTLRPTIVTPGGPTRPPPTPVATPPPLITDAPPTPDPGIIHPGGEPTGTTCEDQSLCSCPTPNEHFCVPCNNLQSCAGIVNNVVCSTNPAPGSDAEMFVEVLSCGAQPIVNLEGIVRKPHAPLCGSTTGVPVLSVVMANCWGTTHLAQCQPNGLWLPYGTQDKNAMPTQLLCQPKFINSPVCGHRPRYVNQPGSRLLQPEAQWPWLVGLFHLQEYICTATIISPHYLLTAAHCVTRTRETSKETVDVRDLRVQRLNSNGKPVKDFVIDVKLYPGYISRRRPSHDVALVQVEREIIFSHKVYPACVLDGELLVDRLAATFARTSVNYEWELIPQRYDERCVAVRGPCASLSIDKDQFCAEDPKLQRFLAEGSSGGPYLVNVKDDAHEKWVISGIVSSSYAESSCPRDYTIFTLVSEFWPWISRCVHEGVCS